MYFNLISVRVLRVKGGYKLGNPKTKKSKRVIPLPEQAPQVQEYMRQIGTNAQAEDWGQTKATYMQLKKTWENNTSYWTAVNYAEAEYADFEDTLTRMETSINEKDKALVLEQVNALLAYWKNFTRIVPKP